MSAPGEAARPRDRAGAWPPVDGAERPGRPGRPAAGSQRAGSPAPGVTLTGVGAIVLLIVAGAIGAVIDVLLGPALGTATTLMLAVGAVGSTWLVQRCHLASVVLSPPLVYLLLSVMVLLLASDLGVTLTGLGATLVYGFPAMAIATVLSVLVASIRHITGR